MSAIRSPGLHFGKSAAKLCAALDLDERVQAALVEFPTKGNSKRF